MISFEVQETNSKQLSKIHSILPLLSLLGYRKSFFCVHCKSISMFECILFILFKCVLFKCTFI